MRKRNKISFYYITPSYDAKLLLYARHSYNKEFIGLWFQVPNKEFLKLLKFSK